MQPKQRKDGKCSKIISTISAIYYKNAFLIKELKLFPLFENFDESFAGNLNISDHTQILLFFAVGTNQFHFARSIRTRFLKGK